MNVLMITIILLFGITLGLCFIIVPICFSKKLRKMFLDDIKNINEKLLK